MKPPDVRSRLAKVLPLLGSDKAGERDAAALAAHRILTKAGLSWEQILAGSPPQPREPLIGTWRLTCGELMKRPGALKAWERTFLADLTRFQRISMKQRYVLKEIADRVLGTAMSASAMRLMIEAPK